MFDVLLTNSSPVEGFDFEAWLAKSNKFAVAHVDDWIVSLCLPFATMCFAIPSERANDCELPECCEAKVRQARHEICLRWVSTTLEVSSTNLHI